MAQHGEANARGTVHAAILAPGAVRLFRYSSGTSHHRKTKSEDLVLPDYDMDNTVVLYLESKVNWQEALLEKQNVNLDALTFLLHA